MTIRHITTSLLVGILLLIGFVETSSAEVPQVISYQGKVTDASGNPVADGPYTMQFRIYDAATGGTLLWNSNNQTVAVAGGIFSVLLGDSPQPALSLDFSTDYWLLVIFNGVNQMPRQRLASVGYAYMASGLVVGTEVSGAITSGTYAALKVTNTATEGGVYGIHGQSASTLGRGVLGQTTTSTGQTYGVYGQSSSDAGMGVHGLALASTGYTYGVYGKANSTGGRGVYGIAAATAGPTYGVIGHSSSDAGTGVWGKAVAPTGTTYGVVGETYTSSGNGVRGVNYATTGYTCAVQGLAFSSA
ncbi:hypothetical protein JXA88_18195, partial [Candidatus Fermentibacteria bacterium]|nr:hypothetical protein [Candidatus Fermentibacteria bacterium]